MFKLGSHDSMTYLPLKRWYLTPFKFIAQCQSKTIEEQYEKYGIRYFDLRVSYDKDNNIEFRHGLIAYKGDVEAVLEYLNSRDEEVWVRFILEGNESDFKIKYGFNEKKIEQEKHRQILNFQLDCHKFEKKYDKLKFHCGVAKWDWDVKYQFKNSEPSIDQKISSMTWKKIDDWCPFFYAFFMNHKNIEKGTDKEYLLIDFLQIQ